MALTLDQPKSLVRAATLADLQAKGQLLVRLNQHPVALFYSNDRVYAMAIGTVPIIPLPLPMPYSKVFVLYRQSNCCGVYLMQQ